jgi:hypothetical protein
MNTTVTRIARAATLEGFAAETAAPSGVHLPDLAPLTTLIVVSQGGPVLVEGGRFFPRPTTAYLDGATFGGSLLKVGWIAIGLRMEIRTGDQRIVTSPVHTIATERASSASVH